MVTVEFGLFANDLSEQLKEFNISKEKTQEWQYISDFLMAAHMHKKVTDMAQKKLYDFLVELIEKEIKETKDC